MSAEELRRIIVERIKKLEEELEFYKKLLEVIDECSGTGYTLLEEVRDEEGNVVARIYRGPSTLKLVFERPLPRRNPYIKFMLRRLDELKDEGAPISYDVESEDENVRSVVVHGRFENEELESHVLHVLKFVALRVKSYLG